MRRVPGNKGVYMNQSGKAVLRGFVFTALLFLMAAAFTFSARAESTGWNKDGSDYYYILPDGSRASGFTQIGNNFYYFDELDGFMKTGWAATADGFRFFRKDGKKGKKGRMRRGGVYTVDEKKGYKAGFGPDGVVITGFQEIDGDYYYFSDSERLGKRGLMLTETWVTLEDGRQVYFGKNGQMQTKKWIGKYYVGADGGRLKDTVTPDGYLVNGKGKKKKKLSNGWFKYKGNYYFYKAKKKKLLKDKLFKYKNKWYYVDANGVRQYGWQSIGAYTYYFKDSGAAATGDVTIDGVSYTFDKKGRLQEDAAAGAAGTKATTGRASILILCGHGQGDPGASSSWGQEQNLTREFGTLVCNKLTALNTVNVDLFNQSYDMFQQMRDTLNAVTYKKTTLQKAITGDGTLKNKTYAATKNNTRIPDPLTYDYVLEIHFDASTSKDISGNGTIKGCSILVNSHKGTVTLDVAIINSLVASGYTKFSTGLIRRSDLLNARAFNEMGVSYGLLETGFIDDGDDMKYYANHKDEMAQAVADAISAYFTS